ncbi:hypothetical protein CAEBREN_12566 [Caenorhabditis brenneri]|uniref:Homeobox domain-containing protein n=1 Tax=Caenorhabditis brenneri TaxID=135651 RepID=G0NM30_CAEBE|nr:hypothetical protein CAEBREN_12566 [Caenorhabditis brenneri]
MTAPMTDSMGFSTSYQAPIGYNYGNNYDHSQHPIHSNVYPPWTTNAPHQQGYPQVYPQHLYHHQNLPAPFGFSQNQSIPVFPVSEVQAPIKSTSETKKKWTRYTDAQVTLLEKEFTKNSYTHFEDREALAKATGLSTLQIRTWFQNRRCKKRQSEKLQMKIKKEMK